MGASGHAEAFAGVQAEADTTIGLTDSGGVEAKVGGEAFAGVEASASGTASWGPFSVSGEASVKAGVGVSGDAGVSFDDGKLTVNFGFSGTVGVGGGGKASFTVDVQSIANAAMNFLTGKWW